MIAKDCTTGATIHALTPTQLEVAQRLARHYLHYWGEVKLDPQMEWGPLGIAEETRCQFGEPGMVSIMCPETLIDDEGRVVVTHTTYSGRLTWEVNDEGLTTFWVNRPQEDGVLIASVSPVGEVEVNDLWMTTDFRPRHVWALNNAIFAVLDSYADDLHPTLAPPLERARGLEWHELNQAAATFTDAIYRVGGLEATSLDLIIQAFVKDNEPDRACFKSHFLERLLQEEERFRLLAEEKAECSPNTSS